MVWRKLICIVLALAVLLALPITASAVEVYTDGNISTTYITYFRDMLAKVSPTSDYVFFRSGANEYTMVVGNLFLTNDSIISFETCKVYQLYVSSSGYNSSYHFVSNNYAEYTVNLSNGLVYSNLGDFPDLNERGDYLETAILLLMFIFIFMHLISRIFNFNLRSRSRW